MKRTYKITIRLYDEDADNTTGAMFCASVSSKYLFKTVSALLGIYEGDNINIYDMTRKATVTDGVFDDNDLDNINYYMSAYPEPSEYKVTAIRTYVTTHVIEAMNVDEAQAIAEGNMRAEDNEGTDIDESVFWDGYSVRNEFKVALA